MNKHISALGLLLVAVMPGLRAAAWTSGKGHGEVILNAGFFETTKSFDQDGRMRRFDFDGRFRKFELNPYVELGLSDRTSLIMSAFLPRLQFRNQYGDARSMGTGDAEVGFRQRLTSRASRTAVSFQTSFLFPTYPETRNPAPGNHQIDIEPRLMVGRGYQLESRSIFWNVEGAWRKRLSAPADQVRVDASLGVDLTRRVMLLSQIFAIRGLRNGTPVTLLTNPNLQSDFDLYKVQGSAVVRINRTTRVQLAWFRAIAGRNTGAGQGVLISLWKSF